MECVVHYKNQSSYSELKKLTEINIKRILEAKVKRLKVGGVHVHADQTRNIPEEFHVDNHGIHLTPCYFNQRNFREINFREVST